VGFTLQLLYKCSTFTHLAIFAPMNRLRLPVRAPPGMVTSSHHVTDVSWYEDSFRNAFNFLWRYKRLYRIGLLPSYLEREGSSLIYMVDDLIKQSDNPDSGFFLYNHDELYHQLQKTAGAQKPTC
jgi:hypothetical protein